MRMTRALLGILSVMWLVSQAFDRKGGYDLSALWYYLPVVAIPIWSLTHVRWLAWVGGLAALLHGVLSLIFILWVFISFMNPISSVTVRIFGLVVFKLEGFGQISFYFLLRAWVFFTAAVILFLSKSRSTGADQSATASKSNAKEGLRPESEIRVQ